MTERAMKQLAQARAALDSLQPGNMPSDLWRTIGSVEALLDIAVADLQEANLLVAEESHKTPQPYGYGTLTSEEKEYNRIRQEEPNPVTEAGWAVKIARDEPVRGINNLGGENAKPLSGGPLAGDWPPTDLHTYGLGTEVQKWPVKGLRADEEKERIRNADAMRKL